MPRSLGLLLPALALGLAAAPAPAKDWYVSAARGKGKKGTMKKPAKDLGNILKKLSPGDRVFIAAGTYLGRGESGSYQIKVPVEIYGGYSDDFSARDPWGAHQTILSGDNKSKNWDGGYRVSVKLDKWKDSDKWPGKSRYDEPAHRIVIDGLVIDNGARNRYKTDKELAIVRKANPKTGQMPTPESGGISVAPWKGGDAVVRNCVVMNTAPTQGVIALWGHKNSRMLAENNLAINNTGNGIQAHAAFHPRDGEAMPRFVIRNNTSVFNQKHDAFGSYGGSGLKSESSCRVVAEDNVLGFNDLYGYDNVKRSEEVIFNRNTLFANLQADYIEFDTKIALADIEDEAELLDEAEDLVGEAPEVAVSGAYKSKYLARAVIDRNAAEADVKARKTGANALRGMLGLNLRADDLKIDSEVWLPRLGTADGIGAGMSRYGDRGCAKPAAGGGGAPAAVDLAAVFGVFDE